MVSVTLSSIVAIMQCFGLIIITHFFDAYKKLTIHTVIYDIQLHLQNFMWANNNWMASSSLDTLAPQTQQNIHDPLLKPIVTTIIPFNSFKHVLLYQNNLSLNNGLIYLFLFF